MVSLSQRPAGSGRLLAAASVRATVLPAILALIFACGSASPPPTPTPTATATPTPIPTPTPPPSEATLIDGVLVYPQDLKRLNQRLPLAIVIENDVNARPQLGLDKAELVYEAIAEGGITRFLAVYWRNDVPRIEPVRSARVYYVEWAAELDAIFVHHGFAESPGPANVYDAITSLGVRNLDGFFLGSAVGERDPGRPSPHNVMTSTELLWATAASLGFVGPPATQPWAFKGDTPQRASDPAARPAAAIDISFGGAFAPSYSVRWDHDPGANGYLRSVAGQPHTDGTSGQRITARNVALQFTTMRLASDGIHLIFDTIGEGQAMVFQDGIAIEGAWRRPDAYSRTRFYDGLGNEIAFNRGQTWIEVVPIGSPVTY